MTRDIGKVGSLARVLVGVLLLSLVLVFGMSWWDAGAAVVLYPLVTVLAAAAVARLVPAGAAADSGAWALASGGVGLLVIVGGTALTFVSPVDGGSLYLFFGVSTIIAGVKGHGGCEVLALPNLLLGRRDRVWCVLFSPLDRIEEDRSRRGEVGFLPRR